MSRQLWLYSLWFCSTETLCRVNIIRGLSKYQFPSLVRIVQQELEPTTSKLLWQVSSSLYSLHQQPLPNSTSPAYSQRSCIYSGLKRWFAHQNFPCFKIIIYDGMAFSLRKATPPANCMLYDISLYICIICLCIICLYVHMWNLATTPPWGGERTFHLKN